MRICNVILESINSSCRHFIYILLIDSSLSDIIGYLSCFGIVFAFNLHMTEMVAIPLWMGRVSPVFDTATKLLIVELNQERGINRETVEMVPVGGSRRISFLMDRGIQTILCGAISHNLHYRLNRAGIQIRAFLSGDAYQLIDAYGRDTGNLREFQQPGGRRRQQRGRRRWRNRCDGSVNNQKSTWEEV